MLRGRGLRAGGDRQVESQVGGLDVFRQVDVGDVERVAVRVEPVGRAVGGQTALEGEAGEVEEVAHRVLVLAARQPPQGASGPPLEAGAVGLDERTVQPPFRRGRLVGGRTLLVFGRHLSGREAVVDLHPAGEVVGVGEVEPQGGQVEAALARGRVVAFDAMRLEERPQASLVGH